MTRYRYRVDGGPVGSVDLPPGASEGDFAVEVSRQRGRSVELAGGGGDQADQPQQHPDERLGPPLALTGRHWTFAAEYLRRNPHIAATSGPGYAFGDISDSLREEIDVTSRARG